MVGRTTTQIRGDEIQTGLWNVYEVEVSQADTITLSDFSTVVDLDQALLIKKSDRTEIATTILKEVVTVTGAALNEPCLLFAAGVNA